MSKIMFHMFGIRLTSRQRAAIRRAARAASMAPSPWARAVLLREAKRVRDGIGVPLDPPTDPQRNDGDYEL